ncbi:hypothetical protein BCAR13_440066 [Paraburkholderia caribensis]|nr:hypothetical protein BCAR13_440066 [Paraburkholderia caribensis]
MLFRLIVLPWSKPFQGGRRRVRPRHKGMCFTVNGQTGLPVYHYWINHAPSLQINQVNTPPFPFNVAPPPSKKHNKDWG